MAWQSETIYEKLTRLRAALAKAQDDLIDAETELADQMADIRAFEAEFEARAGFLMAQLADLEAEVDDYLDRIKQRRNKQVFGANYRSADEQFRRTWQRPRRPAPPPPPPPPSPDVQKQIKKLYRQLARRFHPDLAANEADRAYRTEKMTAINDAYAARSLTELMVFAAEMETAVPQSRSPRGQSEADMVKALEDEIRRCQRRLREIDLETKTLHTRSSVELMLEVKLVQRQGRDLLAEIAADLERKIARKTVERDMIKVQFDVLDSDSGIGI
ncbi:MAG: J domain-containing protein [Chloroflexi bacterium]|nr:J domain-containing protein [Chloroflexota bacterium]